jgi:hypothetical protein
MGSNPFLTCVSFIDHPFDVIPKVFNIHIALIGEEFRQKTSFFVDNNVV